MQDVFRLYASLESPYYIESRAYQLTQKPSIYMKPIRRLLFSLVTLVSGAALGQEVETLDQARALSARQGKPILLEFVVSD